MDKKAKQKSNTTQEISKEDPQPHNNNNLQRIKTGYNQHASHFELHVNPKDTKYEIFNDLWRSKKCGLISFSILVS